MQGLGILTPPECLVLLSNTPSKSHKVPSVETNSRMLLPNNSLDSSGAANMLELAASSKSSVENIELVIASASDSPEILTCDKSTRNCYVDVFCAAKSVYTDVLITLGSC